MDNKEFLTKLSTIANIKIVKGIPYIKNLIYTPRDCEYCNKVIVHDYSIRKVTNNCFKNKNWLITCNVCKELI